MRVRNVLLRHKRGSLTNPVTGLPERPIITEMLENRLSQGKFGLVLISIEHLDAFREAYGFVASDDLLRAVVMMLQDSLAKFAGKEGILAHWTNTDFIICLSENATTELVQHIRPRLEKSFDYFYNERDRESGKIDHQLGLNIHSWVVDPKNESLQEVINDLDHLTH